MDYAKMIKLICVSAVHSYRRCIGACATFVSAALLVGMPHIAQAAVIKINPDDNPDNVINLSGELSATVSHTAEGMVIEIPGVEISLVCDTETDPDGCTVTVASGTANAASPAPSASNDSDSGSSNDSDSGSEGCDSAVDFSCQSDGTSGASSTSSATDDADSDADDGDPNDNTGYTPPPNEGPDPDDPCNQGGYNPSCSNGSASSRADFPTGSARKVDNVSSTYDFGSGGKTVGNSYKLKIERGRVKVVGLKMASGATPSRGSIAMGPVGSIIGVDLKAWVSTTPDGPRLSSACSYTGYVENTMQVRTTDAGNDNSCVLSPGTKYYLNLALCKSSANDLYCEKSGAETTRSDAKITVQAKYTD